MADPTNDLTSEREQALQAWEKQSGKQSTLSPSSAIASKAKQNISGIAIIVLAAGAMGGAYYLKQKKADNPSPSKSEEVRIAERKPVSKLKAQEASQEASTPAVVASAAASSPAAAPVPAVMQDDNSRLQAVQMEVQRKEAERKFLEARLKSSIMASNTKMDSAAQAVVGATDGLTGNTSPLVGSGEHGATDANSKFARAVSNSPVTANKASQIEDLPYKILQGKWIEAIEEPRLISDLPGTLRATVQRDVYGEKGRIKLLPWGTRLVGTSNAEIRKAQARVFGVWTRAIRPDGVEIMLDSYTADQLGTTGMGGEVDNHFAEIFGVSALLSIMGAGASTANVSSSDQANSASFFRQQVQQAAAQTSSQVLSGYANISPTITVQAGQPIRILVNRDLDFTPIYKPAIEAEKKAHEVMFIQ